MHITLLIAHGSKKESANQEIEQLALQLNAETENSSVTHAFLECAAPSIANVIENAITNGATEIDCLPYFLVAGRHLSEDITAIITVLKSVLSPTYTNFQKSKKTCDIIHTNLGG